MRTTPVGSIVLVTLALIVTGSAASALAAEFTFRVPVTVQEIRSDWNLHVECRVNTMGESGLVGSGQAPVPLTNGAFKGNVIVSFDSSPNKNAADANEWNCLLRKDAYGGGVLETDAAPGTQHNRGDHGLF